MEFRCSTLSESYDKVMRHILWPQNHELVTTEDGEKTWQATEPYHVIITNPLSEDYIHKFSPYGKQFYDEYANAIIYGTKSEFVYDYHSRLFKYGILVNRVHNERIVYNKDQIQYIADKLVKEPSSRRAVAITWQPGIDDYQKDVPCLQYIHCWITNGKLNAKFLLRSNDLLMALPQNEFGFARLMKYIADKLNIAVGVLYYTADIGHVYYERDANYLKPWLK